MRRQIAKPKSIAAIVLGLFFFVLLLVSMLLPRDWQEEPAQLLGRVWTGQVGEKYFAFCLTSEERAYRKTIGSHRRSVSYRTVRYTRFKLESRQAPNGEPGEVVVIEDDEKPVRGEEPAILGLVQNGLWVWHNGIELRDPATLAVRFSAERLKQLNPDIAENFPDKKDDAKVSGEHQSLLFKSSDLQYYQVDPESGKATLADTSKLENITGSKRVADGFYYLQSPGRSRGNTSVADFLVGSFLTSTNQWYALMSEEKKTRLGRWLMSEDRVYGDDWRSFYRVPYELDRRGYPEIDPASVEKIGNLRLLNAGFIKRDTRNVWDVAEPSSSLVLHRKDLKKESPWYVSRLTRDGKILWESSLGLADLHTINNAGDIAVFYGMKSLLPQDHSQMLVFLEPVSGKVAAYDMADVEKKKGIEALFARMFGKK